MTDSPAAAPPPVPGLPSEVLARIVAELGTRGDKVISCLRTAAAFLAQAEPTGAEHLRLAESAAYNLREAFDAVVAGRAAAEGGLGAVLDAWRRYRIATEDPAADRDAAREEFDSVIERVEEGAERQGLMTRRLLGYVRDLTGVEPLPGDDDPTVRYSRLRKRAAGTLHEDGTVAAVAVLYDEAVEWFIRFFTPPDDRVRALVSLAEKPYEEGSVAELRRLVVDAHHLGLFFWRVRDAAWLDPLYDAGLIQLPRDNNEPWPVSRMVNGAGAISADRIAEVLDRLLADSKREPEPRRLVIARHIVREASDLGHAGHRLVKKIIAKYPGDDWVQMVAVSIAKRTDPTDPIQVPIADAVIGDGWDYNRSYRARDVLARMSEGLTDGNATERLALVAVKTRRLVADKRMRYVAVDIAALDVDDDDELREPALVLARQLSRMVRSARDLGVAASELLAMVEGIPGRIGERITCRVLAGAVDVAREAKLRHVERRMASSTATGDDRDLIQDILTTPLSAEELDGWRRALGTPPPAPVSGDDDDAARAWRWSMVLPSEVLAGWEEAISAVTAEHGPPSRSALDNPPPRFMLDTDRSPHTAGELGALPVLDAAALVSQWRPEPNGRGVSARELAQTLEAVVKEHPRDWTEDPVAVVTTLREPVYVDHYFRALTEAARDLGEKAGRVMTAIDRVRSERWEPTPLGRDDYDYAPAWSVVDTVTIDMIAAFANTDCDFAPHLDMCWALARDLLGQLPGELPDLDAGEDDEFDGPLGRAINRPYGRGLLAALALGGWEHRNSEVASHRLADVLDEVLAVPGSIGAELRAVLASRRPFLETIAADWLDARADDLFGADSALGAITFEQTIKWSGPTTWFYRRFRAELIAAARRNVEYATRWLLIAYLREVPDFSSAAIIDGLARNVLALTAAAEEVASLMRDVNEDDPVLDRGVQFWEELLGADRTAVPAAALTGLGQWALVDAVDDERWLALMDRTLGLTDGAIDFSSEVADRCRDAQPSSAGLRMLRMMIGRGEPWEQRHVESVAIEALRTAANNPVDDEFDVLRTRLIQRGRHEAADILPEDPEG